MISKYSNIVTVLILISQFCSIGFGIRINQQFNQDKYMKFRS